MTSPPCSQSSSGCTTSVTAVADASISAMPFQPCSTSLMNPNPWSLDGVAKADYWKVVDHCYLCDMCFMTKCPYVPPHEWNVDFPHLMLRAKAVKHRRQGAGFRNRTLSSTDAVGTLAAKPVVASARQRRERIEAGKGSARDGVRRAPGRTAAAIRVAPSSKPAAVAGADSRAEAVANCKQTRGRVALFATCYANYNEPRCRGGHRARIRAQRDSRHHRRRVKRCCGMPKLELGDLDAVARAKEVNIPELARLVDDGWDLVAPDPIVRADVQAGAAAPVPRRLRGREGARRVLRSLRVPHAAPSRRQAEHRFQDRGLGRVAYHAACHQRVQNIGMKTRDVLALVPGDRESRSSNDAPATTARMQ